ncbi:hypothetical protein Tco_0183190 [Tanacetum coccineum]
MGSVIPRGQKNTLAICCLSIDFPPLVLTIILLLPQQKSKKYVLYIDAAAENSEADCDMKVLFIIQAIQVNTKFLNSLPPEWSKFVTDVKLVKDLYTTKFDQLHAYLEQHELHANEVSLLRERNQDPLAFVANQQMTPPHFNTYQYSYNNHQLQQQFSPPQYGSIHPNQQYLSNYPSQP